MSFDSLLVRGLRKGYWIWNDVTDQLQFENAVKHVKRRRRKLKEPFRTLNGLSFATKKVNITFKDTVSDEEVMHFRKTVLQRVSLESVITMDDVKRITIFLCVQKLPHIFNKFFSLVKVNHLLRACVVYMQFYLQTCEMVYKTQHLLLVKPSKGKISSYQAMKEDLDDLRVLIGRFYAAIVLSEFGAGGESKIATSTTDEILLFEYFVRVSTIAVWIALERKYLTMIKAEMGRLFRTSTFNHFGKYEESLLDNINKEKQKVMVGKISEDSTVHKLKSNTPIIHNFMRMDEPKLIMIGRKDFLVLKDERLRILTAYIFEPESKLAEAGVKIGILGNFRRLYDSLLFPCNRRNLKLLVTGSPMDISRERKELRKVALELSNRESEPVSPDIFKNLPKLPHPNTYEKSLSTDINLTSELEVDFEEEEGECEFVEEEQEEIDEEEESQINLNSFSEK